MANRKCKRCEKMLAESAFPNNGYQPCGTPIKRSYCKDCCSARAKERYDPTYARNKSLEKYGISHQEYLYILTAQDGVCATCGTDNPGSNLKHFCIDHDHVTKEVRGLLCTTCNTALGLVSDNMETLGKMLLYIKQGGTIGRVAGEVEK